MMDNNNNNQNNNYSAAPHFDKKPPSLFVRVQTQPEPQQPQPNNVYPQYPPSSALLSPSITSPGLTHISSFDTLFSCYLGVPESDIDKTTLKLKRILNRLFGEFLSLRVSDYLSSRHSDLLRTVEALNIEDLSHEQRRFLRASRAGLLRVIRRTSTLMDEMGLDSKYCSFSAPPLSLLRAESSDSSTCLFCGKFRRGDEMEGHMCGCIKEHVHLGMVAYLAAFLDSVEERIKISGKNTSCLFHIGVCEVVLMLYGISLRFGASAYLVVTKCLDSCLQKISESPDATTWYSVFQLMKDPLREAEMVLKLPLDKTASEAIPLVCTHICNLLKTHASTDRRRFVIHRPLGRGVFGWNYLVQDKKTQQLCVLKTISRCDLPLKTFSSHLEAFPFVAERLCYLCSQLFVYELVRWIPGIQLASHLAAVGQIDEGTAKIYAAQTAQAVDFLHRNGLSHRDLRLNNILLDESGTVKLANLGLSRKGIELYLDAIAGRQSDDRRQFTLSGDLKNGIGGSISYMPPELFGNSNNNTMVVALDGDASSKRNSASSMNNDDGSINSNTNPNSLNRDVQDQSGDWWALGVCLYQMLTGKLPFVFRSLQEVSYDTFANTSLTQPAEIGDAAWDLITNHLLVIDAAQRGNFQTLENHEFYKDYDWKQSLQQMRDLEKEKVAMIEMLSPYAGTTMSLEKIQSMLSNDCPTSPTNSCSAISASTKSSFSANRKQVLASRKSNEEIVINEDGAALWQSRAIKGISAFPEPLQTSSPHNAFSSSSGLSPKLASPSAASSRVVMDAMLSPNRRVSGGPTLLSTSLSDLPSPYPTVLPNAARASVPTNVTEFVPMSSSPTHHLSLHQGSPSPSSSLVSSASASPTNKQRVNSLQLFETLNAALLSADEQQPVALGGISSICTSISSPVPSAVVGGRPLSPISAAATTTTTPAPTGNIDSPKLGPTHAFSSTISSVFGIAPPPYSAPSLPPHGHPHSMSGSRIKIESPHIWLPSANDSHAPPPTKRPTTLQWAFDSSNADTSMQEKTSPQHSATSTTPPPFSGSKPGKPATLILPPPTNAWVDDPTTILEELQGDLLEIGDVQQLLKQEHHQGPLQIQLGDPMDLSF